MIRGWTLGLVVSVALCVMMAGFGCDKEQPVVEDAGGVEVIDAAPSVEEADQAGAMRDAAPDLEEDEGAMEGGGDGRLELKLDPALFPGMEQAPPIPAGEPGEGLKLAPPGELGAP